MFEAQNAQKILAHVLCSITFIRKPCRLCDNVGKYGRSVQATDGNMAHAYCILVNYDYRQTLGIYNYYYIPRQ
jgi:hypothetical protein